MVHKLKIEEAYANAIVSGNKNFEVRYDDRGYQKGDIVRFQAINGMYEPVDHMINGAEYTITYVLHGYGIKEGYCVFGITSYDQSPNSSTVCNDEYNTYKYEFDGDTSKYLLKDDIKIECKE